MAVGRRFVSSIQGGGGLFVKRRRGGASLRRVGLFAHSLAPEVRRALGIDEDVLGWAEEMIGVMRELSRKFKSLDELRSSFLPFPLFPSSFKRRGAAKYYIEVGRTISIPEEFAGDLYLPPKLFVKKIMMEISNGVLHLRLEGVGEDDKEPYVHSLLIKDEDNHLHHLAEFFIIYNALRRSGFDALKPLEGEEWRGDEEVKKFLDFVRGVAGFTEKYILEGS
ncbi:MAG: hypothetical protein QXJ59_04525 [Thermofilaceae archaeon]